MPLSNDQTPPYVETKRRDGLRVSTQHYFAVGIAARIGMLAPSYMRASAGLDALKQFGLVIQRVDSLDHSTGGGSVGLSWQQVPLSLGAIGRLVVPDPLPKILYGEPLRRRMRVLFGGKWIADSYHRIDIRQASRRRFTVSRGDRIIADTKQPVVVYESGFAPRWYVIRADIDESALTPVEYQILCPYTGLCSYYDIGNVPLAACRLFSSPPHLRLGVLRSGRGLDAALWWPSASRARPESVSARSRSRPRRRQSARLCERLEA